MVGGIGRVWGTGCLWCGALGLRVVGVRLYSFVGTWAPY